MRKLFVVVGVVTILSAACNPEPDQTYGVGDHASDGQFTFVVRGYRCGAPDVQTVWLRDEPVGEFCFLDLSVTNTGSDPRTFHAGVQRLVDGADRTYAADFGASWIESERWPAEVINPGISSETVIVLDIPPDAPITHAELHDAAFSHGVHVRLTTG